VIPNASPEFELVIQQPAPPRPVIPPVGPPKPAQPMVPNSPSQSGLPAGGEEQAAPPTQFRAEPTPTPAHIEATVPADAEVWIEGVKTRQTGGERSYTTPPLAEGQTYIYDVKAHWVEGGRPVERTREVRFKAGEHVRIDFTAPAS
jgi:uncharacterized protein (TIGR03000 family)